MSRFVFMQCDVQACRFRYPLEWSAVRPASCPRCGSPASQVAESLAGEPLPHRSASPHRLVALLDNIRSIHNVGSMFRTADGAGVAHLYLCGITATPEHPRLAKAALGAQAVVPWSYSRNAVDTVTMLQAEGRQLWALERPAANSTMQNVYALFASQLTDLAGGQLLVLIVGNERAGVDPGLLERCTGILTIPMQGKKGSLNAAVAFGIAVYWIRHLDQVVESA